MNSWHEIVITVPTETLKTAEAIITFISPTGMYTEDYSDMSIVLPTISHYDYIDEELKKKDKTRATIHLYLHDEDDLSTTVSFIDERFQSEKIPYTIHHNTISETDWDEGWKKYFHTRRIGNSIIIKPSWEEYEKKDSDIVVVLDPGMSFGTGDHESTQLTLTLLEKCSLAEARMLDVGTGSGILSIAALKMGARFVTAIDIDSNAVEISKNNARINSVEDDFYVVCGDIQEERFSQTIGDDFDIITANVVADFHIANSQLYYNKLRKQGYLIVSGIIGKQLEEVKISLLGSGFEIIEVITDNDWCAILLKKL